MKENQQADANILVDAGAESVSAQSKQIEAKLDPLASTSKLDAILTVAGGWAGGNASSPQFLTNSDLMWKQSVWSSLIASQLAAKYLNENGLLTLTGAASSLTETPGMLGYGIAKAAVHHLTRSLSDSDAAGLPKGTTVAAILPVMLDTPMNRKWMPEADTSTWTSLSYVAELLDNWVNNIDKPASGKLVKLITANGENTTELH